MITLAGGMIGLVAALGVRAGRVGDPPPPPRPLARPLPARGLAEEAARARRGGPPAPLRRRPLRAPRGRGRRDVARARVERWVREYPRALGGFRDADGRPPRHTFFYPIETYEPEHLDALAGLCRRGSARSRSTCTTTATRPRTSARPSWSSKRTFSERHGLLARHRDTGELAYGFIHGNWALDNARPDGRWCGVNNELDVLRETGCYADFTLPSAPSPTQTRTINSIYYATDDPRRPRSHDRGVGVGAGVPPDGALMLIQGPLVLDWTQPQVGRLPRRRERLRPGEPAARRSTASTLWLAARVQVPARPDWFFVKLHAHGATEAAQPALLGEPMVEFHRALARRAADDPTSTTITSPPARCTTSPGPPRRAGRGPSPRPATSPWSGTDREGSTREHA